MKPRNIVLSMPDAMVAHRLGQGLRQGLQSPMLYSANAWSAAETRAGLVFRGSSALCVDCSAETTDLLQAGGVRYSHWFWLSCRFDRHSSLRTTDLPSLSALRKFFPFCSPRGSCFPVGLLEVQDCAPRRLRLSGDLCHDVRRSAGFGDRK